MFHRGSFLRALVVLTLGSLLAAPSAYPAHAADTPCFPETGQCISGRFLSFWEQNGGLAVFGYPITPPGQEINRDTGLTYLTQRFERNRFELHPENLPPYDVLLGRLGDDQLRQRGIDWQIGPREPGPRSGCLWFEQTGHTICDQSNGIGFKTYWQRHGLLDTQLDPYGRSLALFGLPLTEAREEVNPSDGKTYLTQWLERARLEWHPNEADTFKVLLGLLGNELGNRDATLLSASVTGEPVADNPFLYWVEAQDGIGKLSVSHVDARSTRVISDQVDLTVRPAAYAVAVAWVALGPDGRQQRVLYHQLPSRSFPGTTRAIRAAENPEGLQITGLALSWDTLYYTDGASNHHGLYARSLGDGQERLIDANGRDPVVAGGVLLWSTQTANGQTGPAYRETWTLYMRQLETGAEHVLTTIETVAGGRFSGYSAANDFVVWAFSSVSADHRVYLYRISTGVATPISPSAAGSPGVHVNGTVVVWATDPFFDDDPSNTWAVQIYDIKSGVIKTVIDGIPPQSARSAMLVGDHIVFLIDNVPSSDYVGRSRSLYLTDLP